MYRFWSRRPCRQAKNYNNNLDAVEFGEDREARCRNLADTAVRIHFSGMRKVPTWRYGRRRDTIRSIWIQGISGRMISAWRRCIRKLRVWTWIIMFSRSSDFSRWDLGCEFCLHILMHSRSPFQMTRVESLSMFAFLYFDVHLIDSVDLIAKRRLQQNNNSEHHSCIKLGSSNEKIMSKTFLKYL